MVAVLLPSHHLPSASISPLIRPRLAPFILPTSASVHHSASRHRSFLAASKSRQTFAICSALASLSVEENYSEKGVFEEDTEGDTEVDLEDEDFEEDSDDEDEEPVPWLSSEQREQTVSSPQKASSPSRRSAVFPPAPKLSVKEKKDLASYAQSLGEKLKIQQVGKSGITPSLATSFVQNLESNELLKIKIHNNCPSELEDAVRKLEKATGSVVISQIGRTVILYRPSIKKAKKKETKGARREWKRRSREPHTDAQPGARREWKPRPRQPYADAQPGAKRRESKPRSRRPNAAAQPGATRDSKPRSRGRYGAARSQTGQQSRSSDRSRR